MLELKPLTDIAELMEWRREVISSVFGVECDDALAAANRRYYEQHITDGRHLALVATLDGAGAGCGALCLSDELPSPDNPSGHCAYIMNVYVRDRFRSQGIAHSIVRKLVGEAQARDCGKIYLESTAMAKPVYREIGFKDMENMMKYED